MRRSICGVLGALPLLALGQTIDQNTVTYDTRACRPGFDKFPFCDTNLPQAQRIADLIGRLELGDIPPLLTARHGGGGSPGPSDNSEGVPS